MTDQPLTPREADDLVRKTRTNDRRFKIAQTCFMALVIAALAGVLAYEITITQRLQQQLTDSHNSSLTQLKHIEGDQDRQTIYINCVAQLFGAHPNEVISEADFNACLKGALIVHDDTVTVPKGCSQSCAQPASLPQSAKTGGQSSPPSQSSNPGQPATPPATTPGTTPSPEPHSLVCTITLHLLGCK